MTVETSFIDHGSPLPLFVQIEQDLRRQILSGALKSGIHLPRETELAERYGASRMTVRRALEVLADARLIRRVQGIGTIVTPPALPITCDLDLMLSFGEQLRRQGHEPEVAVDLQRLAEPPEPIAQALGLAAGGMAIVVRRITSIGKRPLVLNTSWLPAQLFPGLETQTLVDGSLWKTLATHHRLRADHSDNRIEIVPASTEEARLLFVEEASPIVRLTGIQFDSDGHAIEHSTMLSTGNVRCHFSSTSGHDTPMR